MNSYLDIYLNKICFKQRAVFPRISSLVKAVNPNKSLFNFKVLIFKNVQKSEKWEMLKQL